MQTFVVSDNMKEFSLFLRDASDLEKEVSFSPEVSVEQAVFAVEEVILYEATFDLRNGGCENFPRVNIKAKGLSTEHIVAILRVALKHETLSNASLLLNVFNLVKRYNTMDDSFFENEALYIKDLEQFLNVKSELSKEVQSVTDNLAYWFLSCLYSMHKVEYTVVDNTESMPNLYHNLILSSDFFTLSAIITKASPIYTSDLCLVEHGYIYVSELAQRLNLSNSLMEML